MTDDPRHRTFMPPVHRASTVCFDDVDAFMRCDWRERDAYSYGREGSPTTRALERELAQIEGARHVLLAPSGLSAYSLACMALLQAGERVAIPANGYGTGTQMVQVMMRRFGVQVSVYEPTLPGTWNEGIPEGTRLVWIEAPGSITMEVPDLQQLVARARAVGAVTAIDNTYSAGLHLKPFELGIDVSLQALTKCQSGGADVTMGSLACNDDALFARLHEAQHFLGASVSPDDAYLVMRGLPTLRMRYEQSGVSARMIARWFQGRRPDVHRVLLPGLEESPGFEHWKLHFGAMGGLFSVAMAESVEAPRVKDFVDGLKRFRIGFSWGGPASLVLPYPAAHASVRRLRNLGEPVSHLVRFWVGLEPVEHLLEDVAAAWDRAMSR